MSAVIIIVMVSADVYPENIEIHIFGIIKVKLKNKEKRSGGPAKAPKRMTKEKN